MIEPQPLLLPEAGAIPNNPDLSVLVYQSALTPEGDVAARIERMFEENGWPPDWRDGIYDFHHYHSTAHEALGIARGRALVLLGGEGGKEVEVFAGDVLVLPAGTGHKRLRADNDFLVVGAYPRGQRWDLIRAEPDKVAAARQRIAKVPLPERDPVLGREGPLVQLWKAGPLR